MTTDEPAMPVPLSPDDAGALPSGGAAASPSVSVGRHTAIMAAGTLASRVLAMVRSALLVAAIGLTGSIAAESYSVANKLPNVMFAVLAAGVACAALTAGVPPYPICCSTV